MTNKCKDWPAVQACERLTQNIIIRCMFSEQRRDAEIFAYEPIKKSFSEDTDNLSESLGALMKIARELEGPLIKELKPYIVLVLKWKFDYLAKTGESPFLLKEDVDYWLDFFKSLKDLSGQNWFLKKRSIEKKDPWHRTRKAFNYMWPKNTKEERFAMSLKMVQFRVDQILSMLPGKNKWLKNKIILDSGCGPGRYMMALSKYKNRPRKIVGVDSGKEIIKENKKRFKGSSNMEFAEGRVNKLNFKNQSFDFIVSAGVLHHLFDPMEKLIREHARVLKKDGYFFIFIAGKGGLELKIWEFARNFLYDVDIEDVFQRFNGKISPLRLQGLLDHGYGEYQQTSRENCEGILSKYFREIKRVPGIKGLDVTSEIYKDDEYFQYRFGTGNLRYLCKK